ncbi:hypothetical protein EVAR_44241_1 [Eumeta japonica]|uniref:Uncharacterized protein n=1 Tax=Eumeta variegata TaxID=151549 RepID=A0A4C1XAR7_EUMVA|nr:hypothetical protein EVAR_44241_1 [Eumeta japonica]
MAERRGDLVFDAPARSLLHGFPGRDGRAAKSDTEDEERQGRTPYFGLKRMPESRVPSVQTSFPGGSPSPRRRQRITIGFRCLE